MLSFVLCSDLVSLFTFFIFFHELWVHLSLLQES